MPLASIPSPPANGFHLGPLFIHFYGLMYVIGIALAVYITRRRWTAAGGDRVAGLRRGRVGGAGRDHRRRGSTSTSPRRSTSRRMPGGGRWRSGTAGSASGAASRPGPWSGIWRVRRPGPDVGEFMNAVAPALLVAQAVGRIGNYFNQELFGKPSGLPWALEISPAARLNVRDPGGGPEVQHVPAVVPVRADLRPGAGGAAGLAGPPPADPAAGAVRPVRRRVLGVPDLRGDDQGRLLGLLPGAAAELLHRDRGDHRRPGVVRPRPATRPRPGPGAGSGTRAPAATRAAGRRPTAAAEQPAAD